MPTAARRVLACYVAPLSRHVIGDFSPIAAGRTHAKLCRAEPPRVETVLKLRQLALSSVRVSEVAAASVRSFPARATSATVWNRPVPLFGRGVHMGVDQDRQN